MPYFPLFIDLSQKRILVVGAGPVGARKIEKLLPFANQIQVVAERVDPEVETWFQEGRIKLSQRTYRASDLDGVDLVIVAADSLELQKQIFALCQARKIPCNSVDSPAYCSFIFPALVTRGELTVGISTGGKAPGLSAQIRKFLDELLPQNLSLLVSKVEGYRNSVEHRAQATFAERAESVKRFVESLLQTAQIGAEKTTPGSDSQRDPQS